MGGQTGWRWVDRHGIDGRGGGWTLDRQGGDRGWTDRVVMGVEMGGQTGRTWGGKGVGNEGGG